MSQEWLVEQETDEMLLEGAALVESDAAMDSQVLVFILKRKKDRKIYVGDVLQVGGDRGRCGRAGLASAAVAAGARSSVVLGRRGCAPQCGRRESGWMDG